MPTGSRVSTLPFGPCTRTVFPSTLTVTPLGKGIGFFPIRDINSLAFSFQPSHLANGFIYDLPDLTEKFATHPCFACLTSRHHALRRGQDIDSQTAQYARNVGASHVNA